MALHSAIKGKLISVIGDEVSSNYCRERCREEILIVLNWFSEFQDTCVGFLLGGVGEINKNRHPNFMVVDKSEWTHIGWSSRLINNWRNFRHSSQRDRRLLQTLPEARWHWHHSHQSELRWAHPSRHWRSHSSDSSSPGDSIERSSVRRNERFDSPSC